MFTEKIHMTGIYSVNTRKRTHVIDITVPDSSLQTSYGIARCQYRSLFGVSRVFLYLHVTPGRKRIQV